MKIKNYLSSNCWGIGLPIVIIEIMLMAWVMGSSFPKPEISTWHSTLHRSCLIPPNYVSEVAWITLCTIIVMCSLFIWRESLFPKLKALQSLYFTQLIVNCNWMPVFFHCRVTGLALLILGSMDILVGIIIWLSYPKIRFVSLLMIPYLLCVLFASYLHFYICAL